MRDTYRPLCEQIESGWRHQFGSPLIDSAIEARPLTRGFRQPRRQPTQAIVGAAQLVTDLGQDPQQRPPFASFGAGIGAGNANPEDARNGPPLVERVEEVRRTLAMLPERRRDLGPGRVSRVRFWHDGDAIERRLGG